MKPPALLVQIQKRFAAFKLSVQLEVGTEIMVLFGPSGAGKTQTLNAIAGLMTPDSGVIALDGTVFFRQDGTGRPLNLPARRRQVGYVLQDYALFPHLTAIENVAYSLWRQPGANRRALELLDRMHMAPLAGRYPHELSGGQQQRVAIARALASGPRVLLMDEPFAALDYAIRESLHEDLRTLQAESGLIVIYVTHNLDDALTVGDRLALMSEGSIEQVGSPAAVLHKPGSRTALKILGVRNVFEAKVTAATEHELSLDWSGLQLHATPGQAEVGSVVTAYIRPEAITTESTAIPSQRVFSENAITGKITSCRLGNYNQIWLVRLANGIDIEVYVPGIPTRVCSPPNGEAIRLAFPREAIALLHTPAKKNDDRSTDSRNTTVEQ